MLSGHLITRLLVREHDSSGSIRLLAFFARRLRRLLPALLTMLGIVMLMGTALLSTHEFGEQTASAAYAGTWTSNLFFAFTTFDYFSELHLRDVFLHTWSLGVEEQFYLVWPLFLLAIFSFAVRYRVSRDSRTTLLVGFGALFVGSFALSLYWSSTMHLWAYYLMPSRIWQFALGAGVFAWFQSGRDKPRTGTDNPVAPGNSVIAAFGLLLIFASAVFLDSELVYPGVWALLPSLGAVMVIAAGVSGASQGPSKALSHRWLVWLGDRSYSWYLWHWPLLMFGFAWGLKGNPTASAALVLLSLLVAMASYRWIELPFWKGGLSGVSPVRAVGFSVCAIAVTSVTLAQANLMHRDNQLRGAELASEVRQDVPAIYGISGCDTWYLDATLQPCVMGNPDADKMVVLFGDSIAAQWFSFLPDLFATDEWRVVVLTKSACAMVDEDYYYKVVGGTYDICMEWRNHALDYLSENAPDLVFVGSAATYGFSEQQWTAGTRRILNRLTGFAKRVLIIPGTPQLSFDGPGCLGRWLARHDREVEPRDTVCREQMAGDHALRVSHYLSRAAATFDNANVIDLVCPDDYCAARNTQGVVVFRDQQHLTDSFVRAQIPAIKRRLLQLGLGPLLENSS